MGWSDDFLQEIVGYGNNSKQHTKVAAATTEMTLTRSPAPNMSRINMSALSLCFQSHDPEGGFSCRAQVPCTDGLP